MFMHRPHRFLLLATLLLGSCVSHSHSTKFNGVGGLRGEPIEYQESTTWALHLVFLFPILGDAGKEHTIDEFTKEASARGGKRVRIVQTEKTYYWYAYFPLSLLFVPVATSVEGDVEGTVAPEE